VPHTAVLVWVLPPDQRICLLQAFPHRRREAIGTDLFPELRFGRHCHPTDQDSGRQFRRQGLNPCYQGTHAAEVERRRDRQCNQIGPVTFQVFENIGDRRLAGCPTQALLVWVFWFLILCNDRISIATLCESAS
jgi:hypothetical protein